MSCNLQRCFGQGDGFAGHVLVEARNEGGHGGHVVLLDVVAIHSSQTEAREDTKQKEPRFVTFVKKFEQVCEKHSYDTYDILTGYW